MGKIINSRLTLGIVSAVLGLSVIFAPSAYAVELVISGNGSESQNEIDIQVQQETDIVQSNDADVENNVQLEGNTGENTASGNNSDSVEIMTGDIENQVDIQTSLNESTIETVCCDNTLDGSIMDNGAESENTVEIDYQQITDIEINQSAQIANSITGAANTGDNTADDNHGDILIATGDIVVSANIENSLINNYSVEAGVGDAYIDFNINNNLRGSSSNIFANITNRTDVLVENNAQIENVTYWNLNTGGNTANGNMGDVNIFTGNILFDLGLVNRGINIGGIDIHCCDFFDPGEEGNGENGGDIPDDPSDPSSSDGTSDDGDGQLLSEAASTEYGGPSVIGLSDTSSDSARRMIFWVGLLMIVYGAKIVFEELQSNKVVSK